MYDCERKQVSQLLFVDDTTLAANKKLKGYVRELIKVLKSRVINKVK